MKNYSIDSMSKLIDLIGAQGNFDPTDKGPIVAEAKLWNGKTVQASYYEYSSCEKGDIDVQEEIVVENKIIQPFAEKLVFENKPFTVITGDNDTVCSLKWAVVE